MFLLTLKTFPGSLRSSVALYPVPQVCWRWSRVAAADSKVWLDSEVFRSGQNFRFEVWSRWKDAPGPSPTPGWVDPKFQCSPLSQAKKNSDSNQTPKSLLPTLFSCYMSRENWCIAEWQIGWIGAPADSPQNQKRCGLACLFRSKLQDKCWYFYSRLRSLLACGLCTASGSSLSVACGLLLEVYILPRPPCSKLESVRGWRTEVNETAPRRGRGVCGGRECLCASVRVTVSEEGGGRGRDCGCEEKGGREGGICAWRQRQTIMNTKLRRYQRRAKGTGKRISGISVHGACTGMGQGEALFHLKCEAYSVPTLHREG